MANWYLPREQFKGAIPKTGEGQDAAIDLVIEQASREIDALMNRRFIPKTKTIPHPWPTRNGRNTWTLPLIEDLLSVDTNGLTKEGDDATVIATADFFLEPQGIGPPYNRIEIDLASTAFYSSKDTHQRQIRVTGSWGYSDDTLAASALNDSGNLDTSQTNVVVDDSALVGVGDTILMDTEQMFVSEKVLAHELTVIRGVNGTTAATHLDNAAITKYVPPADIRGLCLALASAYYEAGRGGWTGLIGGGEGQIESRQSALNKLRDRVQRRYLRRIVGAV